jgi:NAD(P)H-dependent FMN reductase
MTPLTVLALSGSLRKASLNTAMLAMAARCAPPGLRVSRPRLLGDLPLFNPDLEAEDPPSVARLRHAIARADALLIASPEYAHGVSGVMKNALDWMVGSSVFVDKPVVLWNASPRASLALAALRETLVVMSSRLIDAAALELLIQSPAAGTTPVNPDPDAMRRALLALHDHLLASRAAGGATTGPA